MVNTEHLDISTLRQMYYNILNIVVNTEHTTEYINALYYYNILNIVVNTEPHYT